MAISLTSKAHFISSVRPAERPAPILPENPWTDKEKGLAVRRQPLSPDIGLPIFYRDFELDSAPVRASIDISALGIFELYCNGRRVGNTVCGETVYDEMKPGHTLYTKRSLYYTYDLVPYLTAGSNRILCVCADGWYLGKISFGTYPKEPGVELISSVSVFTGSGKQINMVTDEKWKALWGGNILYTDIWDGELRDMRLPSFETLSLPSVRLNGQSVDVRDSDIEVTAHIGPTVRIRQELRQYPRRAYCYRDIRDCGNDYGEADITPIPSLSDTVKLRCETALIYDIGQNLVGRPVIKIKGQAGTRVTVTFAEMLNDSGDKSRGNDGPKNTLYTDNYRSAKSRFECILSGDGEGEVITPLFTFFGFRYLQIISSDDAEVLSCHIDVMGSVTRETGHIQTSDPEVNRLISNIIWGQRSNYLSIPTDCPQRDERLGWTGDTQVFCRTAAYNADVQGFFRKWMQDVRDCQQPDGPVTDVIPSVRIISSGSAAWADALIVVPYTVYSMYGDTDIIKENMAAMKLYMTWLAGRPEHTGPNPKYLDWLAFDPTKEDYIPMCYYAYDARMMSEMAEAIGDSEGAAAYRALIDDIRVDFIAKHIDTDGMPKQKTQTAYVLALMSKMIIGEKVTQALDELCRKIRENGNRLSTGFVGTAALCNTLSAYGRHDMAYTLLLQTECPSWLYSVRQGATTIWERWNSYTLDRGFGDVGMNSFNHYAYGVIGEWMYRYMAGIEAGSPGFKTVTLQPKPDLRNESDIIEGQRRITYVRASFESPVGHIGSEWQYEDGTVTYRVNVPNVPAKIIVPTCGKASFKMNKEKKAFADFKQENGYAEIILSPGDHEFIV